MLIKRIARCFARLRSLEELAQASDSNVAPGVALTQLKSSPSLLTYHVALESIYNHMIVHPEEDHYLQQIAFFIRKCPVEHKRSLVEILLCKYVPCQPSLFLKELYFAEMKNFFEKEERMDYKIYHFVVDTASRMLFGISQSPEKEGEEEVELVKDSFRVFLGRFTNYLSEFDLRTKLKVVRIAKSLRIYNDEFMENIKLSVQHNHKNMMLDEVLLALAYLEDYKALPYEFFYSNRHKWLKMIDCYGGFLPRKSESNLLRMFEIVAKSRLAYTANMLEQVMKLVEGNLRQFLPEQLIRILFYYSKTKYKDVDLVQETVKLIRKDITKVTLRSMKYLLIALGNLRFDQINFLREVKSNEHFWRSVEECMKQTDGNNEYYAALIQVLSQANSTSTQAQKLQISKVSDTQKD